MWGAPAASVEEWIAREARYVKLDAVLPRLGNELACVGRKHPLTEEAQQFLASPLDCIATLVLEEWPRARQCAPLLPEVVPAFSTLLAEVEEVACIWPAGAGPEASVSFLLRRTNPQTREPCFFSFSPGLTAELVATFAARIGMVLPEALRALYSAFGFFQGSMAGLHEGLIGMRGGFGVAAVLDEQRGWAQAVADLSEGRDVDVPACVDFLPIYANGCGDVLLWQGRNREQGQAEVWCFLHETAELLECAPDVPQFMERLVTDVYLGERPYLPVPGYERW